LRTDCRAGHWRLAFRPAYGLAFQRGTAGLYPLFRQSRGEGKIMAAKNLHLSSYSEGCTRTIAAVFYQLSVFFEGRGEGKRGIVGRRKPLQTWAQGRFENFRLGNFVAPVGGAYPDSRARGQRFFTRILPLPTASPTDPGGPVRRSAADPGLGRAVHRALNLGTGCGDIAPWAGATHI